MSPLAKAAKSLETLDKSCGRRIRFCLYNRSSKFSPQLNGTMSTESLIRSSSSVTVNSVSAHLYRTRKDQQQTQIRTD